MEKNIILNKDAILSNMILSASGWRGIFTVNGDEESFDPQIPAKQRLFAAAAAKVFSDYLKHIKRNGPVIVGRDTRPTGAAIADVIIRTLLAEGREVRWTDVSAAPEIMAWAKSFGESAAGFVYISASHNPVGHNGLKFGLTNGGVLAGSETSILVDELKKLLDSKDSIPHIEESLDSTDKKALEEVYAKQPHNKAAALKAYRDFTVEVVTGLPQNEASGIFDKIRQGIGDYPLGICADYNGSARTVSIDSEFLSGLGVNCSGINSECGRIQHRIVPEGESLDPCKKFLEACHAKNPAYILGYVPDCDGDRGNLVIWDQDRKQARALEAQEVFALSCVGELSYLVWTGQIKYDSSGKVLTRAALAVNDPTSLRIDRIAEAFDIPVFRAEVGEANVVNLARKLREEGCLVRILGEGSNGGNITHPAAVRDPLNTLCALIKMLTIRSSGAQKGLFELWCALSKQPQMYRKDFTLSDIIASLPEFISTGVVSDDALLKVTSADHGQLKDRYQKIFLRDWEARKQELHTRYGISGWEAAAYNGIAERSVSRFGEAGRGGLKITFNNDEGKKIACLWMRGSGTEPVFRIMADTEGSDPRFERDLIEWQRRMVTEADKT
ncbi:MAG: phosphatidylglycerol lysyltransferase [Treponema sp.]|nr:phosphatidylglycerol lysyltransferase [Treponema sp.]